MTATPPLSDREVQAISRVLADARRFGILKFIAKGSGSIPCSHLRCQFPITAATLSHHLKELESVNLIAATRVGKFMHLTFNRKIWKAYLAQLKAL